MSNFFKTVGWFIITLGVLVILLPIITETDPGDSVLIGLKGIGAGMGTYFFGAIIGMIGRAFAPRPSEDKHGRK